MSNADFIAEIKLFELLSESSNHNIAIQAYRSMLGEIHEIPLEKIYPDDSFREFSCFQKRDWDILEIVFLMEDILVADIDETKVPNLTIKMTIGEWIKQLFLNVFSG